VCLQFLLHNCEKLLDGTRLTWWGHLKGYWKFQIRPHSNPGNIRAPNFLLIRRLKNKFLLKVYWKKCKIDQNTNIHMCIHMIYNNTLYSFKK
jgi:hypothetical protein